MSSVAESSMYPVGLGSPQGPSALESPLSPGKAASSSKADAAIVTLASVQLRAPAGLEKKVAAEVKSADAGGPHGLDSARRATLSPPTPLSSRGLIPKAKAEGGLEFRVIEKKETSIPADASAKLSAWLGFHRKDLAEKTTRVPYEPGDIPKALEKFEGEYHCSWHHLKNNCKDPKTLQIINDLRSAVLEEVFGELRKEFNGDLKNIADFGSDKLTSDRDFAFEVASGKQTKETVIVDRFNKIFEAKWGGAPSSVVFDSNAYTMQYLVTAKNPQFEASRSKLQNEGSLLMKLRNATSEAWDFFKSATLSNMPAGNAKIAKQAEFSRVEQQNKELKASLNKEMVKMGGVGADGKPINVEGLSPETLAVMAAKIKAANPEVEIKASNALHLKYKTFCTDLEGQRANLERTFVTLDHASHLDKPDEFAIAFNARISHTTRDLQQRIAKETNPASKAALEAHAKQLQASRVDGGEEREIMTAYKERSEIEGEEQKLHKERAHLEGLVIKFPMLKSRLATLEARKDPPISVKEFAALQEEIGKVKAELTAIETKFGAATDKGIRERMAVLDVELLNVREKKAGLAEEHGEAWDKAGILGMESDRLLVTIQRANLLGMCFAAEAHISEGAFGVVVLNMQAGESDVRTPDQYVQAYREISGFCSGHQAHQTTPQAKIIEASKYAGRLIGVVQTINSRADSLGIPRPPIGVDVKQLGDFFKVVAPLRGTPKSKAELDVVVATSAQTTGLIAAGASFDGAAVDHINQQFEQIGASLEAWVTALPEKLRSAYYAV